MMLVGLQIMQAEEHRCLLFFLVSTEQLNQLRTSQIQHLLSELL